MAAEFVENDVDVEVEEEDQKPLITASSPFNEAMDHVLFDEYEKRQSVILCSDKKAASNTRKQKAWEEITAEINAQCGVKKTVDQVKYRWKYTGQKIKAKYVALKKYQHGTGGGPQLPPIDSVEDKILEMMKTTPTYQGIENSKESAIGAKRKSEVIVIKEEDSEVVKTPRIQGRCDPVGKMQIEVMKGQLELQKQQGKFLQNAEATLIKFNNLVDRMDAYYTPQPIYPPVCTSNFPPPQGGIMGFNYNNPQQKY